METDVCVCRGRRLRHLGICHHVSSTGPTPERYSVDQIYQLHSTQRRALSKLGKAVKGEAFESNSSDIVLGMDTNYIFYP